MSVQVFEHPYVLLVNATKAELAAQHDIELSPSATLRKQQSLQKILDYCRVYKNSTYPPYAFEASDMMKQVVTYSDALANLMVYLPEDCQRLLYDSEHADLLQKVKAKFTTLASRLSVHIKNLAECMRDVHYPDTK